MHINLSPIRYDYRLLPSVSGDRLEISIGGDDPITLDFSDLAEGAMLPAEAIDCAWISGPVRRVDGEIHLTLRLPHAAIAPGETRFPAPIHVTEDGPVELPDWGDDTPDDAVAVIDGVPMTGGEHAAWQAAAGALQ